MAKPSRKLNTIPAALLMLTVSIAGMLVFALLLQLLMKAGIPWHFLSKGMGSLYYPIDEYVTWLSLGNTLLFISLLFLPSLPKTIVRQAALGAWVLLVIALPVAAQWHNWYWDQYFAPSLAFALSAALQVRGQFWRWRWFRESQAPALG